MEYGTPADYLRERVARGREDLSEARVLFEQGKHRLSLIRSYYAIFHVVSAALYVIGIERTKHSALEAAFLQHLVKPGVLETEYGETFKRARKWREDADYSVGQTFNEAITREMLERCERLFARLELYLREQGYMPGALPEGGDGGTPA